MDDCAIHQGDCREVLADWAEPVDAVVTDPPYGLGFMGKDWDHEVPGVEFWRIISGAMKPGAHLAAFGGTRLYHRLACAIEDAGFEIRDTLMWLYGSGFPKSLDVSKAIDKAAGAEREVVGSKVGRPGYSLANGPDNSIYGRGIGGSGNPELECAITAPATDAAKQWAGFGTALKPSVEPVILARKPLDGTVANNVLTHGVGGLNIDGCRIEVAPKDAEAMRRCNTPGSGRFSADPKRFRQGGWSGVGPLDTTKGRWPPNLLLNEEAAAMLDEQSGTRKSGTAGVKSGKSQWFGNGPGFQDSPVGFDDSGGASRFFFTSKASSKDRGSGNRHPTVKPTDLMRWLVRLVAPPGGTVLDPFMGSGSTGVAAIEEGNRFVGIELDPEHVETARKRCAAAQRPLFP
jgi:DNA modification methylase